jgi:Na+/H+ antiporter NhaD/arsenite permease-like protein
MVLLSSKSKFKQLFKQNRKPVIGLLIIAILSAFTLTIPDLAGLKISLALKLSAIILLSVYIVLSFEMVHRTAIALTGALLIIIIAVTTSLFSTAESFDFVVKSIDFNTIGLLLGMMIIVAILGETGIFQYVGIRASKAGKGNLWKLMLIFCIFTSVTSMFIDNVTTILLMAPVTFSIFRIFKVSPIPLILAQVLASNVGGTATLIGDPPNIMIGSSANIDFNSFIVHMGPTIAVSFAASMLLLKFMFRKDLKAQVHNLKQLMKEDENAQLKDKSLLKKSMVVLIGVVALFVVHGSLHLQPSVIALGGAAVLLVITRAQPEKVLREVDWPTLLFFTGLFIIVGAAEQAGMIGLLSSTAIGITGGNAWLTFIMIIWLSAIASAFVDNIPFTATMIPLIHTLNTNPTIAATFGDLHISPLWWALSLGANLGGNGTLIGSSAGVVAAGLSEKNNYPISFNRFLRVGFPFMVSTVGIGSIVLILDVLLRIK